MNSRLALTVAALLWMSPALAEFSGKGELGVIFARGNSDTESANAQLDLVYNIERWTNEFNARGVYARDSGDTNASRFVLANKLDYKLSERDYVLGALRYDRDRFSNFRFQATASVGYGRRLIVEENQRLKVEIGPGFRRSEIRDTGETESEAILRGFADYWRDLTETTRLTNRLLVESSTDNTFVENATGLSVAINSRVSMKAGFTVRHNTDVEPGRKKTDTLTTLNLVYNFRPDP